MSSSSDQPPLLVVLDFNGTILDSTHTKRDGVQEHARARHKYVYFRPGMKKFVAWLLEQPNVRVGIWTSNIRENADALTNIVFPGTDRSKLAFVYSRDECVVHADYSSEKHVQKIFNMGFTPERTIMVDDSPEKIVHPKKKEFYLQIDTFEASPISMKTDQRLVQLQKIIEQKLQAITAG